jgi:hypothetical protein
MSRRRLLAPFALVLLTACGGSWSTGDLELVSALPTSAALRVRLPSTASSAQPLEGAATRRDGLNVGDPSPSWAAAQRAAADVNALLDAVLGGLDVARTSPPTTRTRDALVWGPYPDANTPGLQIQHPARRVAPTRFSWALQARPMNGAFFDAMTGDFTAQASTRQGAGALTVHVAALRASLQVAPALAPLDRLDIAYETAERPTRLEVTFAFTAGTTSALSPVGFVARSFADGRGALAFQTRRAAPGDTATALEIRWTSRGAGRAEAVDLEGAFAGVTSTECWDASARVLFRDEPWPGGQQAGERSACPVIDGL